MEAKLYYDSAVVEGTRSAPMSDEEWALRVDLAAIYRLSASHGWNDLIYTHISARLPGEEELFLLNPLGVRFDEIKASDFLRIDLDGRPVDPTPHKIHTAGFVIHSAVHAARPDVQCVLHCHTRAGMAVSAIKDGLMPLTQHAMMFHGRTGYHESEGFALDVYERERLVGDLGDNIVLILRNHGLLVVGQSVAETFSRMYFLDQACRAQVDILSCGRELILPAPGIAEGISKAASQKNADGLGNAELFEWPALLRQLDGIDPSFRD
jgi:ribulose-5-phosphate 4-epimerase/fuculose-1-phosphate aldolase